MNSSYVRQTLIIIATIAASLLSLALSIRALP
jgi:hypothetical protein